MHEGSKCEALWARQLGDINPVPYEDYIVEDAGDRNLTYTLEVCNACYAVVPFYHFDRHREWHSFLLADGEEPVATTT